MTVYSEVQAAKEMDLEAQTAYANWLWTTCNCGGPEDQRGLAKFELDIEELPEDIRARRVVANMAVSLVELMRLLDMLALWPKQRWRRTEPFGPRTSFNHRIGSDKEKVV